MPLTTLRELTMLQIMNMITDKSDWWMKFFYQNLGPTWKNEILEAEDVDCTPAMAEWIMQELLHSNLYKFDQRGIIRVFNGDVVKCDSGLPDSFNAELQDAVKVLEDVPDHEKDWHPGSHGQVLDLVHPSLFPLVFGQTKVLKSGVLSLEDCIARCGEGVVIPIPNHEEARGKRNENVSLTTDAAEVRYELARPYSVNFQWLPCEVRLSEKQAKITSYINGLHPHRHKRLYELIERVINAAVPCWETTLAPALGGHWPLRIHYVPPLPRASLDYNIPAVVQPDVGTYSPIRNWAKVPKIDFRQSFSHLQVIVKLANIVLTPEKPEYPGGSWHLEGQLNEHICATAIYYYSNENIKASKLNFRQHCDAGSRIYPLWWHEQFEVDFLREVYGCENNEPAVQEVGGVETRQGRLLTFPNILQHRVQPFSLDDHTKPGHRKILALFLVDPYIKVLSTAKVPSQRQDWWDDYIDQVDQVLVDGKLPPELRRLIFDEIENDFPIDMEEAKELRKDLMKERKKFEFKHSQSFKSVEFSLCEH